MTRSDAMSATVMVVCLLMGVMLSPCQAQSEPTPSSISPSAPGSVEESQPPPSISSMPLDSLPISSVSVESSIPSIPPSSEFMIETPESSMEPASLSPPVESSISSIPPLSAVVSEVGSMPPLVSESASDSLPLADESMSSAPPSLAQPSVASESAPDSLPDSGASISLPIVPGSTNASISQPSVSPGSIAVGNESKSPPTGGATLPRGTVASAPPSAPPSQNNTALIAHPSLGLSAIGVAAVIAQLFFA